MSERFHNFSAGPAVLPVPVLEEVREELLCYPGAGASVMEISHRSEAFDAIHAMAKDNIKALLNLPDDYQILFLQGGASLQFSMLAMNFLNGGAADYVECGTWAQKAIGEAKKHGTPRIVWSGKAENFKRMPRPDEVSVGADAAYLHLTSNETIQGVEMFDLPDAGKTPVFCDASSNFLSRPTGITKYALMYAGAQKNIGPSGVAVALLRKDLLERVPANLPSLLDYKLMAENDSLYNTPPCFGIYMIGKVTGWIRNTIGGLDAMEALNRKKANLLYSVIDASGGFYKGHAEVQNRSLMNVTFILDGGDLEKRFIKEATAAGLDGLKGHRSVGGCRASIYNALPLEGVQALHDFMVEFQKKNG
ncbi:MAG: 3-phosphoserine/phosphohydroxythreonine transaminase [Candidatus Hydrogenedentes bacterium]|nr:3-phosphoserine/phosphohydroxythreonine transaminase [Candidatus Hydrogenedentota bacterium]